MKKGLVVIAGGLLTSVAIYSCGGGNTAELEKQLEEANQRVTFVTDSLTLDCQAKLDELEAKVAELEAANKPAASSGSSAPKTETPKKTDPKSDKMSGGSGNTNTEAKENKMGGGSKVTQEATDKKKSKMGGGN